MSNRFKEGDIVVLVEKYYLNDLEKILAEDKHLFEVERMYGPHMVDLRSISTNLTYKVSPKNIRHATLKEKFLRTGNVVKMKCGKTFIVINNSITNQYEREPNAIFNDDLTNKINEEFDIVEVYSYIGTENRVGTLDKMLEVYEHSLHKLIWERKPKIELSRDEIIILRNVEKKYKYIARDNDFEYLIVYKKEPIKKTTYYLASDDTGHKYLNAFSHLFQNITFESGVHLIADLIKENEK